MSRPPVDPLDPLASLTRARGETREVETPPLDAPEPAYDDYDAVDDDGDGAGGTALPDEDRDLLVALAAFQLRYGEAAEALAYLMAARAIFPGDPDVTRLTADALIALDRVDEADEVLSEMSPAARKRSPLASLSLSLVRLAQGRSAEARRLFMQYRGAAAPDVR